jgi:signal transduction histidine kinase
MQVGSALDVAGYIEALERAKTELAHRERLAALGELAAIIAHEVRNPLGAMFASVAGLRKLVDHPDARVLVGVIDEETRRLDSIVSDLLDFARPANLRVVESSLAQVVTDVASSVASRPEAAVVEMKVDVEPELPTISMDRRLMHQAVMNLVLNGLQAMPRGGTLIVRARREDRGRDRLACVDVIDTGNGIDASARARIFDPFFTTTAAGTGLGLPLVKRVVDAHGGELSFVSSSAGTTFTVGVPIS